MNTKPHIYLDNRRVFASLLGAVAAMLFPILLIALFILSEIYFPPENAKNDGYILGFSALLGLMPFLFFSCFVYYLLMSIKEYIALKIAVFVSLVVALLIGFGFIWFLRTLVGMPGIQIFYTGYCISAVLGISLSIGSWAWHRKLNA